MRRWSNGLAGMILLIMIAVGMANLVRVERSIDDGVSTFAGSAVEANQPEGPLTLEAAYVTAEAKAREWNPDAMLTFATLQADWPLDPQVRGPAELPPGGWVRFAFVDGPRSHLLSIVIERYSGEIVTADNQPWDGQQREMLPVTETVITSEAAIVIAESGYGQGYRLQCPIQRHETDVTLLVGEPSTTQGSDSAGTIQATTPATPQGAIGTPIVSPSTPSAIGPTIVPGRVVGTPVPVMPPRWLITYRDGTQPGVNSVEMEIDAMTGEILFVDDRSQGCSNLTG